jgi:hypothetical protein
LFTLLLRVEVTVHLKERSRVNLRQYRDACFSHSPLALQACCVSIQ